MDKPRREPVRKALLVKILQWFYLVLGIAAASSVFWYQQIPALSKINLPQLFIYSFVGALVFYCFVLAISLFTQNTTILIFSLVLVFFTSLPALLLLVFSIPNVTTVLAGHLPKCVTDLALCSQKDGVVVASAAFLAVSVPTLLLNAITIVATVKAIAATD